MPDMTIPEILAHDWPQFHQSGWFRLPKDAGDTLKAYLLLLGAELDTDGDVLDPVSTYYLIIYDSPEKQSLPGDRHEFNMEHIHMFVDGRPM